MLTKKKSFKNTTIKNYTKQKAVTELNRREIQEREVDKHCACVFP